MNSPSQMDCNSACAPIQCHLGFVCGSFCVTIAANMPRLRVIKSDKVKDIPCKNPHKYADSVDPIYGIHKISRNELSELSCWVTHCVKPYSTKLPENDILYNIFTRLATQPVVFIRRWLKIFMLANKKNFEQQASKYLVSKVLSYDNWLDSISKGCKGNILALFGLCMLFSVHALVHLKDGFIWTTLSKLLDDHAEDLKKCSVHLCYLGRGIFIKLIERETPLQVLKNTKEGIQSIVVGEIMVDELQSFDTDLSTGLGLSKTPRSELLSQIDSGKPTKSASTGCAADLPRLEKELRIVLDRWPPTRPDDIHRKAHSLALQTTGPPNVCGKEVRLTLNKLDMTPSQIYLTDRNIVVDARLATLRYPAVIGDANVRKELVSYSSDDTEAYWPLDPKKQKLIFPNVNVMHLTRTSNQKTTQKFKIQVHRI